MLNFFARSSRRISSSVLSRKEIIHQDNIEVRIRLQQGQRVVIIFFPDDREPVLVVALQVDLHQFGKIFVILDEEDADWLFVHTRML